MDNADNARTARILEALSACRTTLRAFIRRRIPQREDVDDILQDVTLQLINVEQPVENVSAWLFRAARNEMIDRGRKKREWLFRTTRRLMISYMMCCLARFRRRKRRD
jgi:DNA-directed RNA polymerase specialized sigma24 family protein